MITSYAQNFEDVILWRALKQVENGFYIDVGAQDPVDDSVSLLFYENGWRGVHIEPTPAHATRLRAARADEDVLQVALGERAGLLQFFEVPETGLSTGDAAIAERHAAAGFEVRPQTVPLTTLAEVFSCFDREIHWLKIDVEGMEEAVIAGWEPSPARPWILAIESTIPNSPEQRFQAWEPKVVGLGYEFVYFDGLNRFYVHSAHADLKTHFGPGPNFFDDFVLADFSFCCRRMLTNLRALGHQAESETAAREAAEVLLSAEQTNKMALQYALEESHGAATNLQKQLGAEQGARATLESQLNERLAISAALEERLREEQAGRAALEKRVSEEQATRVPLEKRLREEQAAKAALKARVRAEQAARAWQEELLATVVTQQVEDRKAIAALTRELQDGHRHLIAAIEARIAANTNYQLSLDAHSRSMAELRSIYENRVAATEAQLLAIYGSTSWAITAPMRGVKRFCMAPVRRSARVASLAFSPLARKAVTFLQRNPRLKKQVSRAFDRFPRLKRQIVHVVGTYPPAAGVTVLRIGAEWMLEPDPHALAQWETLLRADGKMI